MPLLPPKRRVSDVENKLRVLYCLNALGMASQEQLWPFVAQMELMEYLPFCLLLDELRHDGAVAQGAGAVAGMLYLTPEGEKTLDLFGHKLLHTDCQRILEEAPKYAARLNERRHLRAAYEKPEDDNFGALCTVREDDAPTLLVRVRTPESALTEALVKRFDSIASRMLTLLYTLPGSNDKTEPPVLAEAEALHQARPGSPLLCGYGGREHGAVVCVKDRRAAYTLLLLWPEAASAGRWAIAADRQGTSLAEKLTALIESAEAGA